MQTNGNTVVMQTDLCGEVIREDCVHSTTFPGHNMLCFVQSVVIWSPTVGIMLKMEATGRNGNDVFWNHINAAVFDCRITEKCAYLSVYCGSDSRMYVEIVSQCTVTGTDSRMYVELVSQCTVDQIAGCMWNLCPSVAAHNTIQADPPCLLLKCAATEERNIWCFPLYVSGLCLFSLQCISLSNFP